MQSMVPVSSLSRWREEKFNNWEKKEIQTYVLPNDNSKYELNHNKKINKHRVISDKKAVRAWAAGYRY